MTEAEADEWLVNLMSHIRKQHPHLHVRWWEGFISMSNHRVKSVLFDIEVNPDGSRVKFPSGQYHCVDCKLMGTETTMQEYTCEKATKEVYTQVDRSEGAGDRQSVSSKRPNNQTGGGRLRHLLRQGSQHPENPG